MSQAKTRNSIFIVISILLLTFSACASLNNSFESPTVHIVDIKVKEFQLMEVTLNVQLRVINPNDTAIIASGLNCDLEINNNHLASGVSNVTTEIPAFGTAILHLELYSSALDVVKNVMALREQETLKYGIKGRLRIEGGSFMLPYVPFESEGTFDIN